MDTLESNELLNNEMLNIMMMKMNCFCGMVDRQKPFPVGTSEIITIADLWHAGSRIMV